MNFFKINTIFSNTSSSPLWLPEPAAPARALCGSFPFHQHHCCPAVWTSARRLQACLHCLQEFSLGCIYKWGSNLMFFLWATTDFSCPHALACVGRAVCYTAARCNTPLDVMYSLQSFICGNSWSFQHFPCCIKNLITFSPYCLPSWKVLKCLVRVVHNMALLLLTDTWGFLLRQGHPEMKLLRQQRHEWAFQSTSAAVTFFVLSLVMRTKHGKHWPWNPTKRIIQILSLPIILMWFWSNWCDQHLVRLYSSCHSLTWRELAIKTACSAEAQNRASTEKGS